MARCICWGEFRDRDPVHLAARAQVGSALQKDQGDSVGANCGQWGLTGKSRGNPALQHMLGFFERDRSPPKKLDWGRSSFYQDHLQDHLTSFSPPTFSPPSLSLNRQSNRLDRRAPVAP
ncbi:hypothetical protein O77CONTIG1_04414 [Leptolyngbya sp. O-77]|nr:hypothetical protein O77CONTIG1_04414 [Leptolyngbya sp. O-77]